jgi:hypothetical protein
MALLLPEANVQPRQCTGHCDQLGRRPEMRDDHPRTTRTRWVTPSSASSTRAGFPGSAVPSSSTVAGERHSRILSTLPLGSVVTTPRTFIDYVVTEYGIATLRGKTIRQRAEELIAVAHPDFRAELRKEAASLYHV